MKKMKSMFKLFPKKFCRVLLVSMIVFSWGCSRKTTKPPVEPSGKIIPRKVQPVQPRPPEKKIPVVQVLTGKADDFAAQGNFQDALLLYNQALAQAEDREKEAIVQKVEGVLARADIGLVRQFLKIKNLTIPKPLLAYWLGLKLALDGDPVNATIELNRYLKDYPDHFHASDARELIRNMARASFKKDTIGCLLPLSGKYSVFGERALRGIQLAVMELGRQYGQKFKVVIKDTGSNPKTAVALIDEMDAENVMGIVGPFLGVEKAGERAQELGIPMIALTQKTDFPSRGDYLFSNFITPEMQVQALGAYAFKTLGIKKVAILYPDERYGKTYMDLFWNVAEQFGVDVVGVEAYDGSKTDFTEPIQKLTGAYYPIPEFLKELPEQEERADRSEQSADPKEESRNSLVRRSDKIEIDFQAIFIPDAASRLNMILPQLAFNDARGMVLLGTNLWHSNRLLKGSKGYYQKAVITDGYLGQSTRPVTAAFEKTFSQLYKTRPGFLEAVAYDTAGILFQAAREGQVDSRQGLKQALLALHTFEGATGDTRFDPSGSPHKQLFLVTIKKGKFVEIDH